MRFLFCNKESSLSFTIVPPADCCFSLLLLEPHALCIGSMYNTVTAIPFSRPIFLRARLVVGSVDLSSSKSEESLSSKGVGREWEKEASFSIAFGAVLPPSLERTETMSRRILEIQTQTPSGDNNNNNSDPTIVAFWLQRKVGHPSSSRDVVARLGYRLRPRKKVHQEASTIATGTNGDNHGQQWELETDESGKPILVKVLIVHNAIGEESKGEESKSPEMGWNTPMNELVVLQRIAQQNQSSAHVVGTNLIATDKGNTIYAILRHHRDGTLLQFCQSIGNLQEPLARFIFRQILKVSRGQMTGERI